MHLDKFEENGQIFKSKRLRHRTERLFLLGIADSETKRKSNSSTKILKM